MIANINSLLSSANPIPLIYWAAIYFFSIYLFFASVAWAISKAVNSPIETRRINAQQMRTECLNSARSILIFSIGILVPWAMIQLRLTTIDSDASVLKISIDFLILIIWNDIHFYAIHRLLHKIFRKSHAIHHKSIAATAFAAYSMSSLEAILLGSVMPIAMLCYHFSLVALVLLPVWSICINTLAHANCHLFPKASERSLLGFIKHHQNHHSHYHGNFSFFFSQIDRLFGTSRPLNN